MAFAQDLLTRIIDVHWGGGVFIAGDDQSNIFFLEAGKNEWKNLGKLGFAEDEGSMFTGWVQGSSYADKSRPVFVLVGGGGRTKSLGIILASDDGLKWTRVFQIGEDSDSFAGANMFGVVWNDDDNAFYAGGHQYDLSEALAVQTDLLFRSVDGYNWVEADRRSTTYSPDTVPEYKTGLLVSKCSTRIVDGNGNGVPDGVYAYDKASKILMAPVNVPTIDYLNGTISVAPSGPGGGIVVDNGGEGPTPPSDPNISAIGVAFSSGNWLAAGGSFPDYSTEAAIFGQDEKWLRLDPPGEGPVVTVIGGVAGKKDAGL
jgi:hypothetical protein